MKTLSDRFFYPAPGSGRSNFFDHDFFFNSLSTNEGYSYTFDLETLGTGLKELKCLTNLSLDFRYLLLHYLAKFLKTLWRGFFYPALESHSV